MFQNAHVNMSKNIKRFTSTEEYNQWKATDGWSYPSVCFVESNLESQVYYNNEFIMRWNDSDVAKTPTFLGDISWEDFKAWVDGASTPCEIKKDGTGFAYLNPADLTKVSGGTASHYGASYGDYLQLAEIENVNVGLFQDSRTGTKEVRFNFDLGCPEGFHKWFSHPYWNATKKKWTKLFGRYNVIPVDLVSNANTKGIICNAGFAQHPSTATSGSYSAPEKGSWNSNNILAGIKATLTDEAKASGYEALSITYWEYLVMSYIFCAYFNTFDTQSIIKGLQNNQELHTTTHVTGTCDSATVLKGANNSHYKVYTATGSNNEGYRFLWLEDALHGQQWIWGAGWVGNSILNPAQYWMTFDDRTANLSATLDKNKADVFGNYAYNTNSSYITKIDVYGNPTDVGGSSSTGFYDGMWSYNLYDSRVAYLGGLAYDGLIDGVFSRYFYHAAGTSNWNGRGRLTLNR